MNSLFISDVHIGNVLSQHALLKDYLTTVADVDEVYIVGDFLDLWRASFGEAMAQAIFILRLLRQRWPGKVYYIVGNHDDDLRHLALVVPFITSQQIINVGMRKGVVLHGDTFDELPAISDGWFASSVCWLVNKFNAWALIDGRKSMLSLSDQIEQDVSGALQQGYEQAILTSNIPRNFNFIITGHSHTPCIKRFGDFIYANCGDSVHHTTVLRLRDDEFVLYDYAARHVLASEKLVS